MTLEPMAKDKSWLFYDQYEYKAMSRKGFKCIQGEFMLNSQLLQLKRQKEKSTRKYLKKLERKQHKDLEKRGFQCHICIYKANLGFMTSFVKHMSGMHDWKLQCSNCEYRCNRKHQMSNHKGTKHDY